MGGTLFFHGIPHSPEEAGWPVSLFYASGQFGRDGGLIPARMLKPR